MRSRQTRVMSYHHQAGAKLAVQFEHQRKDLFGVTPVQIARGFVGQHQVRCGHQGPRHGRALAFAAGQFGRTVP